MVKTKKETFEKIHDEILYRVCNQELDVLYFQMKADEFKKDHPDHKTNLENKQKTEAELYWSKIALRAIVILLKNYEDTEKTDGGAENKA